MHKHNVKKKIVLLVIVLTLVIAALGVAAWWLFTQAQQSSDVSSAPVYSSDAVSELIVSGDTEAAKEMVAAELEQNDSIEVRRDVARVNAAAGDYQAVIDTYTPAIDSGSSELTSDDYQNIAEAYDMQGDKENAAKYYREAAANWPKDDPIYQSEVDYLNAYADELEGKLDPNA